MAKSASVSAKKFVDRASVASGDYADGVRSTDKDQNAAAIAAAGIYKQAVIAAANAGRFEKGLQKAGKQAYLDGVSKKGEARFAEGVATAASKYATNSGAYDTARTAASSLPRGVKGSAENLQRVAAVVKALRAAKVGAAA